jgi:3-oxoacyl-(acyl-carrier-protein) synthase
MKRRRVKITGIGPVTPAGIGREEFWKGIQEPVSRVRPFTKLGDELGPFVAAHIPDFDVFEFIEDRTLVPKGSSRQTMFAVASAVLALSDAGISTAEFRAANAAIVAGSSLMDFGGIVGSIDAVQQKGTRGAQPRALYSTGVSSVSSSINRVLGATARTMAVSTQCCAGMDAIGYAVDLVATGDVEMVLCGGVEAPLHRFPLVEFRAGEMTPATDEMAARIARPFDLWRTTGVVSEGGCMVVIEPDSSPRKGYSQVAGYAFGNDSAAQLCDGMMTAGRLAIAAAGMKPADIDAISAWGPGHRLVDAGEAQSMVRLFGQRLSDILAVSIKGAIGTPLGAAPAIQIAAAVLAQTYGVIPPTVNWEFPDPMCPLNLSRRARIVDHRTTLLNAHGVGGVNASLVLERC